MRVVVGSNDRRIRVEHFYLPNEPVVLDDIERSFIAQALERTQGNQSEAARLLGLTRYTLRYRMEKYGLRVVDEVQSSTSTTSPEPPAPPQTASAPVAPEGPVSGEVDAVDCDCCCCCRGCPAERGR